MSANTFWTGPGRPAAEGRPEGAGREPLPGPGQADGAFRVGAADVVAAGGPPPTAQTFEDLGIPTAFRQAVEKELSADEQLLWVGRPSRHAQSHPNKKVLSLVAVGLLALAGALLVGCLGSAAAGGKLGAGQAAGCFFSVILAVAGGMALLIARSDPSKSCRCCYAVTNRRALLVEMSVWRWGPAAQSYLPQQLLGLERRDNPERPGSGDLIFEHVLTMPGNTFNPLTGAMLQQGSIGGLSNVPQRVPRGFLWLDQVREVEGLIRTTLLRELEEALDAPPPAAAEAAAVSCACGAAIEAPAGLAGKWVQCPRCAASVPVSGREPAAAPAPAAGPCREDGSVPADLKEKALAGLDGNERPVWVGQPVAKLVVLRSGGYVAAGAVGMLVALLWLLATLSPAKTVTVRVQRGRQVELVPVKQERGSPLLPAGLFLLSLAGPAVAGLRWRAARRTCYVLTNRRALVYKEGLFGPTRESYSPLEVSPMRRSDSWLVAGGGDLIFRTVKVIKRTGGGIFNTSVRTIHYGFLAVAPVAEVEALVRETLIDRFVDKLNQANAL